MKRILILSHDVARQRALEEVKAAPEGYRVTIEEPRRNGEQNAKFHALCTDIARSGLLWAGKRRTADQWKVLLVSGHATATKEGAEMVPGLLCMAEGHVVAWTRKQLQQRSGAKLSVNLPRSARMAEIARQQSTLTMARVREIRASGLRPKQAADTFGIPLQTAARIIRHAAWREYGGNPFRGLGARA